MSDDLEANFQDRLLEADIESHFHSDDDYDDEAEKGARFNRLSEKWEKDRRIKRETADTRKAALLREIAGPQLKLDVEPNEIELLWEKEYIKELKEQLDKERNRSFSINLPKTEKDENKKWNKTFFKQPTYTRHTLNTQKIIRSDDDKKEIYFLKDELKSSKKSIDFLLKLNKKNKNIYNERKYYEDKINRLETHIQLLEDIVKCYIKK